MSRSRWNTPIAGAAGRSNCKSWRTQENRRYRAYVKNMLRHERYDDIQGYCGRFGNEWDSPRDGHWYFGDYKYLVCGEKIWTFWGIHKPACNNDRNYHYCIKEYNRLLRK